MAIHVIDAGLSNKNKGYLEALVNRDDRFSVFWITPTVERFEGLTTGSHHISTYYRLALPELLEIPHVLYLDADTLVLNCLSTLWDRAVREDFRIAAVEDQEIHSLAEESELLADTIAAKGDSPYFNAGVLFLDLEWARQHDLTARLLDCLKAKGHLVRFADQSAINITLAGQIHAFELDWNLPAWVFDASKTNILPDILHYTNHAPWLERHYRPSQALFERVADELGIRLPKPEKGLCRTISESLIKWILAPARVLWHGLKVCLARRRSDARTAEENCHIMRHWWIYFVGGPKRVLRYQRRIREIRDPAFQIFSDPP